MRVVVENLTNACVSITTKNEKIVIDPWLTDGKYLGTWHNFPRVSESKKAEIEAYDFCCITHLHKDHFDLDFIKRMSFRTKFLVPKVFGYQVIVGGLKANGFNDVTVLNCGEDTCETNDFLVKSVPPLNSDGLEYNPDRLDEMSIDGGFTFFHKKSGLKLVFLADDNLYSQEKVSVFSELLDNADLIAFAYSSFATDFPFKYDFSTTQKKEIVEKNEQIRFEKQVKNLHRLNPKFILPYSSEFVPVGSHSNSWMEIFPKIWTSRKDEVAERYKQNLGIDSDTLYPGEKLVFEGKQRLEIDKCYDRSKIIDDMISYRSLHDDLARAQKSKPITKNEWAQLQQLFESAAKEAIKSKDMHNLQPSQNIVLLVNHEFLGELTVDNKIILRKKSENKPYLQINSNIENIINVLCLRHIGTTQYYQCNLTGAGIQIFFAVKLFTCLIIFV